MKKMIIFAIVILNMCFSAYAQAIEWEQVQIGSGSYINEDTVISTGRGWIKWKAKFDTFPSPAYYSVDGENWEEMNNSSNSEILDYIAKISIMSNFPEYGTTETDDYILLFSKTYQYPFGMSNYRSGKIYAFDKNNFNLVKECDTSNAIAQLSCVDNVCYVTQYTSFLSDDKSDMAYDEYRIATSVKTYRSTDFENWYECEDEGIPITNGINTIFVNNSLITAQQSYYSERDIRPQQVYTFYDGSKSKKIIYENIDISQIFVFRDLFVAVPSTDNDELSGEFLVSGDGVYFSIVDLPEENQNLYTMCDFRKDKVLCSINSYKNRYTGLRYYSCDIDSLKEQVKDASLYLQYNGNILAFEQPPVIQDDRTLIPLRFLFEQMGAEVTWNQDEQTATVTQDNTAITVGIDDTEAEVNGQTVSMDVPAQLINDKTMVPVRFLSEQLGYTVTWDGENRIITIE